MKYMRIEDNGAINWYEDRYKERAGRYASEKDAEVDIKFHGIEGGKAVKRAVSTVLGLEDCWMVGSESTIQVRSKSQVQPKNSPATTNNPMAQQQSRPHSKPSFAKNDRVRNPNSQSTNPATNNPFKGNKSKGDLADRISDSVAKSFSPGGLIVFGGGVFASALILNLGFWGSITSGMPAGRTVERILMQDWAVLGAACGGWAISLGTTFFQTYPIIGRKGGDSIAKQFLASLFRPDLTKMRGGDDELARAHNGVQADFWRMMGWMWMLCTVAETLSGIIFIGDVFGKGLASLGALLLFVFSIAGCQVGAYWIIQGRNIRLPKEGRGIEARLRKQEVTKAYSQLK